MTLVLFVFFLLAFIAYLVIISINKKLQKTIHFLILVLLMCGLLWTASNGSKLFQVGPGGIKIQVGQLEVHTKGGDLAKFEIKNPTDKNVEKEIRFAATANIENINIDKGNSFFSRIGGGKGNNYVTYNVNMPPQTIASGTMVSASSVIFIIPQEIKKQKEPQIEENKALKEL